MEYSAYVLAGLEGRFRLLKTPDAAVSSTTRDAAVSQRVSEILSAVEQGGMDAVLRYAREFDGWERGRVELDERAIRGSGDGLSLELRGALELGAERTQSFAKAQRAHLTDFEAELVPGLITGARYIPVNRVGAYLPAGRFPLLASAFMTVGVAKAAGVPTVLVCTPPQQDGEPDAAVLYAAYLSGVDRAFVLGGVQALAAMAFGLLGERPVDMLVGAGNAYVAEAKRQLFGRVAIDLLAGPSEVAGRAWPRLPRCPRDDIRAARSCRDRGGRASAADTKDPGHRRGSLARLRFGDLGQ